ncbi:hypothetical protein BLGI_4581 [Brevibacillus laterosporus GI-9]|nr:hypothetical protein BLGI_4581 [Brevibacillus laterosporus GI-9]
MISQDLKPETVFKKNIIARSFHHVVPSLIRPEYVRKTRGMLGDSIDVTSSLFLVG